MTAQEIEAATYDGRRLPPAFSALVIKLQVLLDQVGMSPGAIDGLNGDNLKKALAAFETSIGHEPNGALDQEVWAHLPHENPVMLDYEVTQKDVAGPYLGVVPADFGEMAKLKGLYYSGPLAMLGERFHMDVELLKRLNPDADFNRAGTHIAVTAVRDYRVTTPLSSLVADKSVGQLRGYGEDGKLVVAYPATIGSDENPSPSGTHLIRAVAENAAYYYDPRNFKEGNNNEKLRIPPGPNNPIGTTWIDLSEPTYGIHGTPEPSKISKTHSHGCVRLTNWDVEELVKLVKKGVPVKFEG
jgi:lipoprotein-anchoring transpeptidase ErfK/SrfK